MKTKYIQPQTIATEMLPVSILMVSGGGMKSDKIGYLDKPIIGDLD